MNSPTDLSPLHDPTSSPSPEERSRRRAARRRKRLLFGLPIAFLFVAGAAFAGWAYFQGPRAPFNGPTWTVGPERLQLSIVERGTLESRDNRDIVCRIKAGKKGTSGIIRWVIDDGTEVTVDEHGKPRRLMEVEDSALKEDLQDQENKVNKARADKISAEEFCRITESQNFSDIESAKTTKILAEIELKKFLGDDIAAKVLPLPSRDDLQRYLLSHLDNDLGKQLEEQSKSISDILQMLSDIEGRIELARSDREMALDRAAWSQRMVKKGYLSRSQMESDKSKLDSVVFTLKKTQVEYDLYRKYTIEQKVTELWSKVKEADRALDRVKSQAISKLTTAQADLDSKKAVLRQESERKEEIEGEIVKCVIYASHNQMESGQPLEGLVVYFVPEQARFGSGTQQAIIAQGEPVREGQKLMRIPDLNHMLVNVRVHEAMVSKVKGEVNRPTGFSDVVRAAMSIHRMPLELASNYVAFNDARDQYRDHEFENLYSGQRAFVRIDAYPSKVFAGHVRSVATVASQADWMSSDVKVYQTIVAIDDTVSQLKPGMSAEVTILAEESTEPVLTLPIQSVVGSIAMGGKRKCFVVVDGQPVEREIELGRSNDKMVEVKSGVHEGDKVVLNPRPLLGDKSGMKTGTPGTRRGVDSDEMDGAGAGKKGGGKKGDFKGAMPPGGPGGFPPGNGAPGASGKQYNRPDAAAPAKK